METVIIHIKTNDKCCSPVSRQTLWMALKTAPVTTSRSRKHKISLAYRNTYCWKYIWNIMFIPRYVGISPSMWMFLMGNLCLVASRATAKLLYCSLNCSRRGTRGESTSIWKGHDESTLLHKAAVLYTYKSKHMFSFANQLFKTPYPSNLMQQN